MNIVLRVIVGLVGLLFLVWGLRWLIDPAGAAAQLGMPLLEGVGRSTQIGDLSVFFACLGVTILIGVKTLRRSWFYIPAVMLSGTAIARLLAWGLHDAAMAATLIAAEVIIAGLLFIAARMSPAP